VSEGHILVVDDESQIRRVMRTTLVSQGYEVSDARSGDECLGLFRSTVYDLVLLDMNMPGLNGVETCRCIRMGSDVAIIMLTVRNTLKDKIDALDAGADDYVTKPFSTPELLARIRAALRRSATSAELEPEHLQLGHIEIDFKARQVISRNEHIRLTGKEFDLLSYLAVRRNKTITHRELLQAIWGPDYGGELEYLRVFINRLRQKIEQIPATPKYLLTDLRIGYRLRLPE
jgi:two-component system KDP operon response regulator KdpE